jgi:capsular polysaccharide biosynthesis protein
MTASLMARVPSRLRPAAARLLPGGSASYGPPRRWQTHAAYTARYGGEWRLLCPRHGGAIPAHTILGRTPPNVLEPPAGPPRPVGVLTVHGVQISKDGWLVGNRDTYLPENSWYSSAPGKANVYLQRSGGSPHRLSGRCLSLVSDWCGGNYFHALVDGLSRLSLFETLGGRLEEIDWVYVPGFESEQFQALLPRIGVPAGRLVSSRDHRWVSCDTLVAPSFPGRPNDYLTSVPGFLRERFGNERRRRWRRLYVGRSAARRRLANEAEVLDALGALDFELIVPGGSSRDTQAFAEAVAVVGAHGAGLANLVFSSPGTILVEVVPPRHRIPLYCVLAHAAGMRYACVLGTDLPGSTRSGPDSGHTDDFALDRTGLDAMVRWLADSLKQP